MEWMVIRGKYKLLLFSGYLPNFKNIWHFADKSATLSLSITLCWFHLAKGKADGQGSCASCLMLVGVLATWGVLALCFYIGGLHLN